jgi:hypothetical protein
VPSRAVLFAITEEDLAALLERDRSPALVDYMIEVIEDRWDSDNLCELDKAWDAIHRCLTDGSLDPDAGEYPLNAAVFGREGLHAGTNYFVGLTRAADVSIVAEAVSQIDSDWIRRAYSTKVPTDYAPEYGETDREYTAGWFEALADFWRTAATRGRSVIFTVDQ